MLGLVACNNNANIDNKDHNISSMATSMSSKNYPHTKAVLIQDARYQFVPLEKGNESQFQMEAPNIYSGQSPIQWQDQKGFPPNSQKEPQGQQRPATPTPDDNPAPTQTTGISQIEQQVIDLTNTERRKNGLPDLKADTQLSSVAQKKSEDMQQNNYFSHTSPTYGSPFDMMRDFGVTYQSAGENIAKGQQTPQEVVQAWMNSEGHRKNILSNNFTHIGVGYEETGKNWTQMFIGK